MNVFILIFLVQTETGTKTKTRTGTALPWPLFALLWPLSALLTLTLTKLSSDCHVYPWARSWASCKGASYIPPTESGLAAQL